MRRFKVTWMGLLVLAALLILVEPVDQSRADLAGVAQTLTSGLAVGLVLVVAWVGYRMKRRRGERAHADRRRRP